MPAPPPLAMGRLARRAVHRVVARDRAGVYDAAATPASGDGTTEDLGGNVAGLLARLCDADRIAAMDDDELRAQVQLARRLEGSAALLTARATRELERRGALTDDGASSATDWLKATTGRSGREAARTARLASTIDELPATATALADGRIGVESADTIVRSARDTRLGSPDQVEDTLLPVATRRSPEDLRTEVRRREQEADSAAMLRDERRAHALRRLSLTRRDDGMWDVFGRLTGEAGTRLRTLLNVYDLPDPQHTPDDQRRRPEQRLADALDTAVSTALDIGELPQTGGVSRPHVSVVVDLATLDADLTDPDDPDRAVAPDHPIWAELAGARDDWGGTLSPQATLRICCDASISRIVTAGTSQVLDVGRLTRQWSPAQRRAIRVRDQHCRGPNCNRPIAHTEIHHLTWWRHGGHTAVDNGLSLCHGCHRKIHDLAWHAELDVATAGVTWTSPDGRRTIVTHPRQRA